MEICSFQTCGEDGLRHCTDCNKYYCMEHLCDHLIEIDNSLEGTGWLSTGSIIEGLTDEQLIAMRLKLAAQLYAVDREIDVRKFDKYKRERPKSTVTMADLAEERSVKRFGGRKTRPKAQTKTQKANLNAIGEVLANLTPEERKRIQDAYNKRRI
jgi:predicted lipid-binding transport protein (Tim44 family)